MTKPSNKQCLKTCCEKCAWQNENRPIHCIKSDCPCHKVEVEECEDCGKFCTKVSVLSSFHCTPPQVDSKKISLAEARGRALKSMEDYEKKQNEYIQKEFDSIAIYTEKDLEEAKSQAVSETIEKIEVALKYNVEDEQTIERIMNALQALNEDK